MVTPEEPIEGGDIIRTDEDLRVEEKKLREKTAGKLAFILVGIMGGSVLLHYSINIFVINKEILDNLSKIFNVWLPVISGFVGGASTYYFTKEK